MAKLAGRGGLIFSDKKEVRAWGAGGGGRGRVVWAGQAALGGGQCLNAWLVVKHMETGKILSSSGSQTEVTLPPGHVWQRLGYILKGHNRGVGGVLEPSSG